MNRACSLQNSNGEWQRAIRVGSSRRALDRRLISPSTSKPLERGGVPLPRRRSERFSPCFLCSSCLRVASRCALSGVLLALRAFRGARWELAGAARLLCVLLPFLSPDGDAIFTLRFLLVEIGRA